MSGGPRVYRPRAVHARGEKGLDPEALTAELNPEQRAAATHGDGPLLIVAGAGTGKTRTLVHRVAHLVARGVKAERILLLTFTRRAAEEMLTRVERLVGGTGRGVHGGTFHATAHRLLRRFGDKAGIARDFSIMDQGDAEDLMQISRAALGYGEKGKRFPKKETLHAVYSRHVNTSISIAHILGDEYPAFADLTDDFAKIFADYTNRKAQRNLVDYDDLLLFWALLLEQSPEIGGRIAGLYDHVLVDEYQDTNVLQSRILRGMCSGHRNVTVVGDDAQSIYAFRGATVKNILEFPAQFPGTTIVRLEQNYRSTQPILDVANTVLSRATEGYKKALWTSRKDGERPWLVSCRDEDRQTAFVADRILQLHEEGTPLSKIAVLFRAGYQSASLEIELTNRRIPFEKWGGLKFLEAAHVKDVLAFLRVGENPRDEVSWYRLLLLLPGVGDATARNAVAALAERDWSLDGLADFRAPSRARASQEKVVALLRTLRGEIAAGPGADIATVRTVYDDILRERYDRAEPRLADLEQLQVIAAGYPSRAAFLSALALEPPQGTHDLLASDRVEDEDDALILSTVHSAKGKEWDAVFIIWAVDGMFPMTRAIANEEELEEERRLMYVALTRPRHLLAVTFPLNSYGGRRGADYSIDQLSRFFDNGVRAQMERITIAESGEPMKEEERPAAKAIDLRALMKGMWG